MRKVLQHHDDILTLNERSSLQLHHLVFTNRAVIIFNDRIAHYRGVIMGAMASQITNVNIVFSTVYSGAYHRKHQLKLSVTGLCEGNSQMASNTENVSIWWHHHVTICHIHIYNIYKYIYVRMRYNFLWMISMAWHSPAIYQHTTVTINICRPDIQTSIPLY